VCKIVSFISCKGGVGKTTSAVNISSYIHRQGKRVLAVDRPVLSGLLQGFEVSTYNSSRQAQQTSLAGVFIMRLHCAARKFPPAWSTWVEDRPFSFSICPG